MADATDDFNRANGALGANWTSGGGTLSIASNVVSGVSGESISAWTADSFDADQYSQIVISTVANGIGPTVRKQSGAYTFYGLFWDNSVYFLYKYVGGSFSFLGATIAGTLTGGDTLRVSATGTTIEGFKNGVSIGSRTDSAIATAGHGPGFLIFDGTARADDWLGGPIAAGAGGQPTSKRFGGVPGAGRQIGGGGSVWAPAMRQDMLIGPSCPILRKAA